MEKDSRIQSLNKNDATDHGKCGKLIKDIG